MSSENVILLSQESKSIHAENLKSIFVILKDDPHQLAGMATFELEPEMTVSDAKAYFSAQFLVPAEKIILEDINTNILANELVLTSVDLAENLIKMSCDDCSAKHKINFARYRDKHLLPEPSLVESESNIDLPTYSSVSSMSSSSSSTVLITGHKPQAPNSFFDIKCYKPSSAISHHLGSGLLCELTSLLQDGKI